MIQLWVGSGRVRSYNVDARRQVPSRPQTVRESPEHTRTEPAADGQRDGETDIQIVVESCCRPGTRHSASLPGPDG